MTLLERIAGHAAHDPQRQALAGAGFSLDYRTLVREITALAAQLASSKIRTLALDMDNGPAWALCDLAALSADVQLIPIPPFFSAQQVRHCLEEAGVQAVISDNPGLLEIRAGDRLRKESRSIELLGSSYAWIEATGEGDRIPEGVSKVTFTSGTTGEPKGVMLAREQMVAVATSLAEVVEVSVEDRHLALMPLSVLLENICGLYTPLLCGATAILPPLAETGMQGASGLDASVMARALFNHRATTAIFTPQTLQGVVEHLEQGGQPPDRLRFGAVGGAPVSGALLQRAAALGLPIREGYGLSECASVTTLNPLADAKPGSVGRPLPHLRLRIAEDGEVLVAGNLFRGYLGQSRPETDNGWWRTGDIGRLDRDGFLHLTGRKRNMFVTAYGRNVAPEWVESELVLDPAIAQAAVFGEARPFNVAVLQPTTGADVAQVDAAVSRINDSLPDYARVRHWLHADEPFTIQNGGISGTGRLKRHNVFGRYQSRIESLYMQEIAS
jgi:long-subunit acyl-CoA synthetase (AMP-forming)